MKCLNFFIFLIKIIFAFQAMQIFSIQASEISDSYQVRYERWLKEKSKKNNLLNKQNNETALFPSKIKEVVTSVNETSKENPQQKIDLKVKLPTQLPDKTSDQVNEKAQTKKAKQTTLISHRNAIDSREEFLTQIPKDNTQVQALLNMVDHTKVYFSINENGALKDVFRDPRFREIYTEEMDQRSRELTYYFFKGYQDHHREVGAPATKKLNREISVNREKLDSYLESSGIKSKLTRSLTGKYPKTINPVPESEPSDSTGRSETAE